jgi:hypothetical protein
MYIYVRLHFVEWCKDKICARRVIDLTILEATFIVNKETNIEIFSQISYQKSLINLSTAVFR